MQRGVGEVILVHFLTPRLFLFPFVTPYGALRALTGEGLSLANQKLCGQGLHTSATLHATEKADKVST